jgi:beta-carotene 3-hydroxylase
VSELLAFAAGFVVMEPIAYALHRWVMHGPGMPWHRSHHAPPAGRWERNDLFPLCFAVVGIAAFSGAATGLLPGWAWWTAAGVTAYGTAYLLVHEVVIHGRLPIRVPSTRYLRWLRDAHRAHHVDGGEPFGMLVPLTSRTRRQPRAPGAGLDDVVVRDRARRTRARL